MDAEQIPTYHLIKDVIMELLPWQWEGNKVAYTLSSDHEQGTYHT